MRAESRTKLASQTSDAFMLINLQTEYRLPDSAHLYGLRLMRGHMDIASGAYLYLSYVVEASVTGRET